MYRWEVRWEEFVANVEWALTFNKGFSTENGYKRFMKKLEKKGAKITGLIVDGERVL